MDITKPNTEINSIDEAKKIIDDHHAEYKKAKRSIFQKIFEFLKSDEDDRNETEQEFLQRQI